MMMIVTFCTSNYDNGIIKLLSTPVIYFYIHVYLYINQIILLKNQIEIDNSAQLKTVLV